MNKMLKQLNGIYSVCGTWAAVAYVTGYNRATINRWFAGTRGASDYTKLWISHVWNGVRR